MLKKKCSNCMKKKEIAFSEYTFEPFEWKKVYFCEECNPNKQQTKSRSSQ